MATTNKDNKAGTVEKNDASLEIQEQFALCHVPVDQ